MQEKLSGIVQENNENKITLGHLWPIPNREQSYIYPTFNSMIEHLTIHVNKFT